MAGTNSCDSDTSHPGCEAAASEAVTFDTSARPARIVLAGAVTLHDAEALYFAAARLLDENADVDVDCGAVHHLGAAAVQILLALGLEVGRRGKRVRLVGASDLLTARLRVAGMSFDLARTATTPTPAHEA